MKGKDTRPRCLVCGGTESTPFLERESEEGQLQLHRCLRCEHGFLTHQPTAFEAERYDYYRRYIGLPRESRQTSLNERRHHELLDAWGTLVQGRRLLDVGCGDGHLVQVANASGWSAMGIDMSSGAIELAQSWGIACRELDFFDASLDEQRYDVIYMSELIEHVTEPDRFIARAEQLLAPGGLVYITTPNFDSLSRRILQERWTSIHLEHLSYFNESSFRRLVEKASRMSVRIETRNLALLAILGEAANRLRAARSHHVGPATATTEAIPTPTTPAPKRRAPLIDDQKVREKLYASRLLLQGMKQANRIISGLGVGDTLIATLRS